MKTKVCRKCGIEKSFSEFHKHCSEPDGFRGRCRMCSNEITADIRKTKHGLITNIYSTQRRNSKDRPYGLPDYTNEELHVWMLSQSNFEELYNNWVESGYQKMLVPSCDRLDDYQGYALDNLRLVTWEENQYRYFQDSKNGINNKQNKSIMQYDRQGNFIKEYYSVSRAAREISYNYVTARKNISMAANNTIPSAYGFLWKFKDIA